jgi:hypothetical protein
MRVGEQNAVEAEANQDDRRELEVLLALAASEYAGKAAKNRDAQGDAVSQVNAISGGVSQS